MNFLDHSNIPVLVLDVEEISINAIPKHITPNPLVIHAPIKKAKFPCDNEKRDLFLKKIPAPITEPITIIIADNNVIFFFVLAIKTFLYILKISIFVVCSFK
ncbi:MAG: hypothetical protein HRT99_02955 [Mycoplasmatales bacterium]|nr:hypothetical protein [Mycoplasmatales bacterium]